jgi:Fuc2NAc and GlcNAc transferase
MDHYILYFICIIVSGAGAWFVSKWGRDFGLVDRSNNRSSHDGVVPKGGGIGIMVAFIFSSFVLGIPTHFWLSATFLALISLFGDKNELSPKIRLPVQFIAAIIVIFPLLFSSYFADLGFMVSALCIFFLSVFIVGTANFYNFMDGINGIAAITGVVGFGLLAFFTFHYENNKIFTLLSVCVVILCLGFLPFNFPKAKVFVGDVGSILIGFVFAGVVVLLAKSLLDFICYASFIFPFYADVLTTMAVRFKKGENLFHPHRSHIYQHLANELKVSHWKISLGYGLVQLNIGTAVWLTMPLGLFPVLILLLLFFGLFGFANYAVRKKISVDYIDFAD